MRPGRRLGIDVGQARVGLAVCDPSGVFATPVRTLSRDLTGQTDLTEIAQLATELAVLEIVVGLPLLLSGDEGQAARLARSYARELAVLVAPTPVRLVDERLTTVTAHKRLRDSGVPGRGQRAVVDQAAAVVILQSALDTETVSGRPPGELLSTVRKPRKKERHR